MKPDYTHISIVLDRSGSMESIRKDTIGGFNRFLADQVAVPGHATLTLVQFDGQGIDCLADAKPISAVSPLTETTFVPRGSTPLYDAVAEAIISTGDRLMHMAEANRPAKVVFVVLTDGFENASTKFSQAKVRDMIKHQREVYKWEFVFLGANIDSYEVGASIAVDSANTMNFADNSVGVMAAYCSTSDNLRSFRVGNKRDMSFEPADYIAQNNAGAKQ